MLFLYNLGIHSYFLLVFIFSFFNKKARLWLKGRQGLFKKLAKDFKTNTSYIIWFHCASLGEFEQGRPVLEKLKSLDKFKNYKILVTFFSPSGYEVRKDYEQADFVYYLPLDTKKNAKRFIEIVKPSLVCWVRYEFWYHHLKAIQKQEIPLILFSATFRKKQLFFKHYGSIFRKLLKGFSHIFIQSQNSQKLLQNIDVQNVSVAGDTRFDRVNTNAKEAKSLPLVEQFKNDKTLFIVGSSWEKDLDVILPILQGFIQDLKVIIAPHEIKEATLKRIEKTLDKTIRFSQAKLENIETHNVLLIDNIGMLASIYQYGDIAYVGGAFGEGLHNILEPATFALPVIFGKDYKKFPEAKSLIEQGGAFSIKDEESFEKIFLNLYRDKTLREKTGKLSKNYVIENIGGADKVVNYLLNRF